MQRPTLNPTIFDDTDGTSAATDGDGAVAALLRRFSAAARTGWQLLWKPLLGQRRANARFAITGGALGALALRLMVVGILLLITVLLLVHLMAHPLGRRVVGPPAADGVLVESVPLRATDGIASEAWLAPAIDASRVKAEGDAVVRATWPAVLLVCDQNSDGRELDALIPVLHRRGFVVMLLHLRASGADDIPRTFGLVEKRDVLAALAHLRSLPFVRTPEISIVATGTGASAALLAAQEDRGIARMMVYGPPRSFDTVLASAVDAPWLRPACRWGFEILHQVDVDDLDLDEMLHDAGPNVLMLAQQPDRRNQREMIGSYLQAQQMSAAR
jgi:hypothetical protein